MRKVRLKTLCGATRDIEVDEAPFQSPIRVPMQIGTFRGVTFSSGLEVPSLNDPPQIVTRTFEYHNHAAGNLAVYRERYEGPSQDAQTSQLVIGGLNREIEELRLEKDRVINERAEQFGKLALALGCFGRDEVPTYADATPRMVEAIERLKGHEEAWQSACYEAVNGDGIGRYGEADCAVVTGEKLAELKAKAKKWDEHEKAAQSLNKKCSKHHYELGVCTECGHENSITIETPRGDMVIKADSRPEYNCVGIDLGDEWKPDLWSAETAPDMSTRETVRVLEIESGPGISAKFKDTTGPAEMSSEPITCDMGADWDD